MADFITSVISSGAVKEGLEKGPQGIAHASFGLVEQFLTRGLIGRVLPGVGLINPLLGIFTERAVSTLKAQIAAGAPGLFGVQGENLSRVTKKTQASEASLSPPITPPQSPDERFGPLHPDGFSVIGTVDKTTPAPTNFPASNRQPSERPLRIINSVVQHPGQRPPVAGPGKRTEFVTGVATQRAMRQVRRRELTDGNSRFPEDFIQQHRFIIFDSTEDGLSVFEWERGRPGGFAAAGFAACDSPSVEVVTEEIKEGTWEFPRQVAVGVAPGRMTLQKGMVRTETDFFLWLQQFLRGLITRRTITIVSFGRSSRQWVQPEHTTAPYYAQWVLHNCAPVRYSAGQGWDARSGEVQIAELELAYEWFDEEVPAFVDTLRPLAKGEPIKPPATPSSSEIINPRINPLTLEPE